MQVGDRVLSRDTLTGHTTGKRVSHLWQHFTDATLALQLPGGERIETTAEHPFYVEGAGWRAAQELGIGTSIVTRAGPALAITQRANLTHTARRVAVYNFTVEDYHTYFVGHSGVLVHNASPSGNCKFFSELPVEEQQLVTQARTQRQLAGEEYKQHVLDGGEYRRTFATADGQTGSGNVRFVSGYGKVADPQNLSRTILADAKNKGFIFATNANRDGSTPGLYHASHAELKAYYSLKSRNIGTSREMCDEQNGCRDFFRFEAKRTGESITVADPGYIRIFKPSGETVVIKEIGGTWNTWPDGTPADKLY